MAGFAKLQTNLTSVGHLVKAKSRIYAFASNKSFMFFWKIMFMLAFNNWAKFLTSVI